MNELLRVDGLVAGWQRPACAALSFAVAPGEVLGLCGPNGVGKSTVLAALAGRAKVFAGRVEQRPGLRLAWQTQEVPPLAGLPLSGRDLLALTGAGESGLPPWLAERLSSRLDRLSGGQRHYLALWAILAAPADLLLLDEPTNNLDPAGVDHLGASLRARAATGQGVIVVSHDAEFVRLACDRVHWLESCDVE